MTVKILMYHRDEWGGHLNIPILYLKTYFDINYPEYASRVEWMQPIQGVVTDQKLIDIITTEKVNLFCTSNYMWNNDGLMEQCKRIKLSLPKDTLVVAGGPHVDPHTDPNYFEKYPFLDYAVYAAGEQAFSDIIISILENRKIVKFNVSNMAWFDSITNKQIVTDFKYVPEPKTSPYLYCANLLEKMFNDECKARGRKVSLAYMLTRGCPYECTFCDWASGLSNKVTRRKNSYKDEIDLFQRIGIRGFFLSDANVGQYDEDVDMIEYFAKKNLEENVGFALSGSLSKLRKANNLKIYKALIRGKLNRTQDNNANSYLTVSVQDLHDDVLENIDRPGITWQEHLDMVNEIKTEFPEAIFKVQLIMGLPGQTVDKWRATLREVTRNNLQFKIFQNELLSTSPAVLNPDYQEKFKFTYSTSYRLGGKAMYRGKFPESCVSFTKQDTVRMTVLSNIYDALANYTQKRGLTIDIEPIVDKFLKSDVCKALEDNLSNNWNDDKFFYTINFSQQKETITAHDSSETGGRWASERDFIQFVENA